jgi:SAM-dependent methyltransferase
MEQKITKKMFNIQRLSSLFRILSNTRFLVRRLQTKFIIEHTSGESYPVVVDVGCGKAPHHKHITYEKYIGVDIEDRGGVPDVVIADVNNGIPLPDATANLVICTETLEHTKKPHFVVSELYRITKRGGTVLLTAPMVWPVHEAPYDFFRYTNFGMEYLFKEAGFTEVRIQPSNGYLYSMCQLAQLYMRHPFSRPIVWMLNLIGFLAYKFERNRNFALGQHVVAIK